MKFGLGQYAPPHYTSPHNKDGYVTLSWSVEPKSGVFSGNNEKVKLSFSSAGIISAVGMKHRKELTEKNRAEE